MASLHKCISNVLKIYFPVQQVLAVNMSLALPLIKYQIEILPLVSLTVKYIDPNIDIVLLCRLT